MLNPNAPIPLYRQLADQIADGIRNGTYRPGSCIPSEPKLERSPALRNWHVVGN